MGSGNAQFVATLWHTTTAERLWRYLTGKDCRYSNSVRSAVADMTNYSSGKAAACDKFTYLLHVSGSVHVSISSSSWRGARGAG
jgi:hypothetical protein